MSKKWPFSHKPTPISHDSPQNFFRIFFSGAFFRKKLGGWEAKPKGGAVSPLRLANDFNHSSKGRVWAGIATVTRIIADKINEDAAPQDQISGKALNERIRWNEGLKSHNEKINLKPQGGDGKRQEKRKEETCQATEAMEFAIMAISHLPTTANQQGGSVVIKSKFAGFLLGRLGEGGDLAGAVDVGTGKAKLTGCFCFAATVATSALGNLFNLNRFFTTNQLTPLRHHGYSCPQRATAMSDQTDRPDHRDPKRPPLIPGQKKLTQEQRDYFMGQVKTLATLERISRKFNLLDEGSRQAAVEVADQNP